MEPQLSPPFLIELCSVFANSLYLIFVCLKKKKEQNNQPLDTLTLFLPNPNPFQPPSPHPNEPPCNSKPESVREGGKKNSVRKTVYSYERVVKNSE